MMEPPIVAEDGHEAATAVVNVARLAERPLSQWCNPSRFLADGVERRQAFSQQFLAGCLEEDLAVLGGEVGAKVNPGMRRLDQRPIACEVVIEANVTELVTRVGSEDDGALRSMGSEVAEALQPHADAARPF